MVFILIKLMTLITTMIKIIIVIMTMRIGFAHRSRESRTCAQSAAGCEFCPGHPPPSEIDLGMYIWAAFAVRLSVAQKSSQAFQTAAAAESAAGCEFCRGPVPFSPAAPRVAKRAMAHQKVPAENRTLYVMLCYSN